MTLLSVHLITYNNEQHIEDTLQSILKQKVDFEYEIVVGDDNSTDNTLKIINKYASTHPNLFKIHKNDKQQGILKNYKATLDRCIGTFVFDIAGDDMLKTNNALQEMVNVLNNNTGLGFVDSGFDSFYEDSNKTISFKNKSKINSPKNTYKETLLLGEIAPIGQCYRKEQLYRFVDFNTYINMNLTIEDYPILVDMVMNTDFERINESLVVYRIHDKSFSHEKVFEKQYFLANQMKNIFDYFSEKYNFENNLIETYNKTHFNQLLFYAGFFQNKNLGKEIFSKIKSKRIKDYIHYWASQNNFFRKLVSII
jgi:glycosyltransferase involved in cell wall biosynthesis